MAKKLKKEKKQRKARVVESKDAPQDADSKEHKGKLSDPDWMNDIDIKALSKKYKGSRIAMGDDPSLVIQKMPFGVPMLDTLLNGGIPVGKMTLIYGEYSVGKTFLTMKLISMAQKAGKSIFYIDVDKSYEPNWWQTVGIDIASLPVIQPSDGDEAFDMTLDLLEQKAGLVVLDSLDLLVPRNLAVANMDDNPIGAQARLVAEGLRRAKRMNNDSALVCMNHVREGIGKYAQMRIPGGRAQEDFSNLMMWVARGPIIKENEIVQGGDEKKRVGFKMRVTLEKDKISGKRYESCEIPFLFKGGEIDELSWYIDTALNKGVIRKTGAWYDVGEHRVCGILGVKDLLNNDEELREAIISDVTTKNDKEEIY